MFQSDLFPAEGQLASVPLAYAIGVRISEQLATGCCLTRADISGLFAEVSGVQEWGSAWTIDDYNNAAEIGAILWLKSSSRIDLTTSAYEADARFDWLEAALPPRHVRSETQVELQQFSTPPMLAWLMAKAAAVSARDTLLEPSAGNGALALWGSVQNASLVLNEIDPARRDALGHIFPAATTTMHDGELIADLHRGPAPSVVLMNPPFARSQERGKDGETAQRHLRSAIRAAASGARIVAIMPEGFDASTFGKAQAEASMLLDVRLQQMFRRTGTGIAVRMVVIDKVPTAPEPAITGDTCDLIALHELLLALPPRAEISADVHSLRGQRPTRCCGKITANLLPVRPVAPFAAPQEAKGNAVDLAYSVLAEPAPVPEQTGIYLPYRPSRIAFEAAPVHPTPLVESVAMGSVAAPQPDVTPRLPANWQADGLLSEAQCETLVYAAQAFARDLPGLFKVSQEGTSLELSEDGHTYRQGFFLGDGTGAGKGRQIAAVIMDRWLAGERRHVWITKNEALLEDARRDWDALGGMALDIRPLSHWKLGQPVMMSEGILFVTYPTLRSGRAEDTRLGQILAWAGENFDGVVAFDEAHAMANALGGSTTRGKVKGSEQGMAGLRLQNYLPRARVLYASATGASDIANLGYAARLGLWGPETAFPTHEAFMTEIRAGGVAAMELVARDLKAQGLYLARALSFAGVEYEILEHNLTEVQVRIYDAYADAWAIIHRNLEAALEATRVVDEDSGDTLNRNAKAAALSIFEGTKQRFFAQLLLSMKLPSLIPAMEHALSEDHSVVVQLVSTAEAMLDRRLADLTVEEREALDIDLSPREYVIDYLSKSFPVRLMQVFADEDGNLRSEAMSDEEGNPVFCPRAIAARDALIEQLCALPPIATALDAIIEHFGTEAVAEVTGRTRRLVLGRGGQQRLERRSQSANVAEAQSFMEGTKRILVFSDAGGTGRSYHADLGAKNQQRRVHFLLEPGWRADNAIQGLGRTNRTNQASAPLFRPVTTDVKGERRFISTIARRLDALGALTRGQRQTGGQNLFDPADNLESDYARDALSRWFQLLYDGKLEATSFGNFVERTGLRLENPDGGLTDNLPTIQRWLNRILALPIALQNAIFEEYLGLVEARIEAAREAGTLDQGLETVMVDSFTVLADELLRSDSVTGAETRLVSLEVSRHLRPLRLQRLVRMHEIGSAHAIPLRNARSGKVALSVPARRLIADDGAVIERQRLLRPLNTANWTLETLGESHWEEINVTTFMSAWQTEEEEAATSPVTERIHLATGLLLPVWKRLPGDHVRVTRLVAEDGQSIIGREVLDVDLATIADTFGLSGVTGPSAEQIGEFVLTSGKPLGLASHDPLTVKRSLVGGEQRLELTGFSPERLDWYKGKGCFTEIIRYRTRLFVPVSKASSVLPALAA
ncbi:strawberry notch-like NTP hydrolase domain-containing protein [Erythrobacter sp. EC-HK427]|uniref:strawberry notch-like NTP hydrolase domain-containing protein n=1 Tax=Erythrobacter sp. EC-HK427 TaxID=2038396 RepID=UPI0012570B04|nr:strawberry notch family protein [Erythrobacter sp. EC-HK427]VVT01097.1 Methyltransferase domain-containing protein [Erythrobacter sp. EC-HK427]